MVLDRLGLVAHRDAEIAHQAVVQAVDPAVHGDDLAASPGILDHRCAANVAHLLDDVELAETIGALVVIRDPGCTAKTYPEFFEDLARVSA